MVNLFLSNVNIMNFSSLNLFVVVLAHTECHLVYVYSLIFYRHSLLLCTVQSLQLAARVNFKRFSYCFGVSCKASRCRFMLQINYLKYLDTFSSYAQFSLLSRFSFSIFCKNHLSSFFYIPDQTRPTFFSSLRISLVF